MGDLWNIFYMQDVDAIKKAKRVANGTQKLRNLNKLYLARENKINK